MTRKSRKEAINLYYSNPNICKYCLKVIEVKEGERIIDVTTRSFCNHSCAAKYSSPNKGKKTSPSWTCQCGKLKTSKKRKYCEDCKQKYNPRLANRPIKKVKTVSPNWTTYRTIITRHAKRVYKNSGLPKVCAVCGYSHFVDICHIKGVANFSDNTLIEEVNKIENLIALCPNHHREFDNGIIPLAVINNIVLNRPTSNTKV